MEWSCKYGADNKPNQQQIINFVRSSLWETLNNHLHQIYMTEPKYNYSNCSMQPGWNVKYSKNGKSLCTLYPMEGYFITELTRSKTPASIGGGCQEQLSPVWTRLTFSGG